MKDVINTARNIHFIGIGGIGVSAIARMMMLAGKGVSGSDTARSGITDALKKLGAKVFIGHQRSNLGGDTDLVIYTVAVSKTNPELVAAKKRGIETLAYPEALGLVSREKYTIAVSGTHGKTTTTAMIAHVLKKAGLDPTAVIGSLLKDSRTNFLAGKGKYFVVEACEYKKSFLNLSPRILVITNIDSDHLDYYKTFANLQMAFREMARRVPTGGYIVANPQDTKVAFVLRGVAAKVVDYTKVRAPRTLVAPGAHNMMNARAALLVAKILGIPRAKAELALATFPGTWRRFEYKGKTKNGALMYDDYAHHPTEIAATLSGARELYPKKKITIVFQPHLYSRTKLLLSQFASALGKADSVVVTDIYAAREKRDPSISADMLADKICRFNRNTRYLSKFKDIAGELKKNTGPKDVIITMGAGDVFHVAEDMVK